MSEMSPPQTLASLGISEQEIKAVQPYFRPPKAELGDDITAKSTLRRIEGMIILATEQAGIFSESSIKNQFDTILNVIKQNIIREAERKSVEPPARERLHSSAVQELQALTLRAIGTVKAMQANPQKMAHKYERIAATSAAQTIFVSASRTH